MSTLSKKPPAVRFVCTKCDGQFSKWQGQCESCGGWGTVKEVGSVPVESVSRAPASPPGKTASFSSLTKPAADQRHTSTGVAALDRVLGGGLVPGSVTLIGGEPGIGKSTLLAQVALEVAKRGSVVLYVTGEESPMQVGRRLERLQNTPLQATLKFLDQTDSAVIAASNFKNQLQPLKNTVMATFSIFAITKDAVSA